MKKILTVASILSTLLVSNAMAEGEHTLGASGSLYNSSTELRTENQDFTDTAKKSKNHLGIGIFYKYNYVFNNNLFIGPEVFLDLTKYENTSPISTESTVLYEQIETFPNFGAKFNIGYRFKDKHDIYVGAGVQSVYYETEWTDTVSANYHETNRDSALAPIAGIGYDYHLNDNWSLGAQYNIAYTELEGPDSLGTSEKFIYDLNYSNFKVNLGYTF